MRINLVPVSEDPRTMSGGNYEENTGQVDGEYFPEEEEVDAGPHITPPKRAIRWDGKGKRDAKARDRVISCLEEHGLETNSCALSNVSGDAEHLEYAHLLPLATSQETVSFFGNFLGSAI